jgi:WD40 repeat protein
VKVTSTGSGRISSVINVSGIFYTGHTDGCLQCFQSFSSGMTKRLFSSQAHEDVLACLCMVQLSAIDCIATGSGDGSVKLWSHTDGQLLGEIEIGTGVSSMCVHQGSLMIGLEDGMLLHVEVDGKYRLKVAGEMRGHVRETRHQRAFAAHTLAPSPSPHPHPHSPQVADILALHSDTKHVISCASDATVRVWVPAQHRCIHVIEPFRLPCTALHVHQATLFLGGQQGQLAAYSTPTWQAEASLDDVRRSCFWGAHALADAF